MILFLFHLSFITFWFNLISTDEIIFNYLLFFFKRLRDKLTCSGLISLIFNLLIISSDIKVWTASYGVLLFKIVLLVEFMWEAMRSQSSCVKLLKEEYLGSIYLMYSWFFSMEPFW